MSNDDFDKEKYEEETKELGMAFWISLVLGFAFPLIWIFTAMVFYEFWNWENKKLEYEKKHKPKVGFFKKIKICFTMILNGIVVILIIGCVVFFLLK